MSPPVSLPPVNLLLTPPTQIVERFEARRGNSRTAEILRFKSLIFCFYFFDSNGFRIHLVPLFLGFWWNSFIASFIFLLFKSSFHFFRLRSLLLLFLFVDFLILATFFAFPFSKAFFLFLFSFDFINFQWFAFLFSHARLYFTFKLFQVQQARNFD